MKKLYIIVVGLICLTASAQHKHPAYQTDSTETVDHSMHNMNEHTHSSNMEAPISVMGSHLHEKGSWMVSYRYMDMAMKGLLQGADEISNTQTHMEGYMATPLNMDMGMHMIGLMYAPSNKFTLMAMFGYLKNNMNLQMLNMMSGMVVPFSTESSGFRDIQIAGLYSLVNKDKTKVHASLGFSIPTGRIDEKHVTPMSNENAVILPYAMQIGSGTFDTKLGLTYVGTGMSISWGSQLNGIIRFGENSNDYRMGNNLSLNNWLSVKAFDWLSLSGRLEGGVVGDITGANPDLSPMMVTTANTDNYGGTYVNSGLGFNTYVLNGALKDLQFGFEVELPLSQNVNGIQLEQKEMYTVGLLYTF